jgi:kinesin family member 5
MAEDTKKKGKVERVMVHCRIRPLSEEDVKSYGRDSVMESIEQSKGLIVLKKDYDKKTFVFDSVFDSSSTQKEIYAKVADPVVSSVLQGYNGTIFAYGQTGTGKTFTMIGSSGENKGIIPRSMQQIFTFIQASQTHSFQVKIGFLQLYMEMLQDLLHPDESKPIRIREDPDEGVYLTGVNWVNVNRVKDCMELLSIGDRNRSTAFTSMNAHSSRSHAVYMVKIEKRVKYTPDQLEELEKKGEMPDQSMTKSTLYLVDLAGSERVKKSRASGNRLDEAKNINLALLALGNCIQALSDKKAKYVPFRDSKLTRLLEDSLGGNSKTSLIVTVGPSAGHAQETLSALQFGLRAMKIENRPELNIKVDYRALCAQLQSELDKINDGSNMFNIEKEQYLEEINSLKAQIEKLLAEREQMESLLEEYRKGHNDLTQFEDRKKSEMLKIQNSYKLKLEKKEAEHKKFLDEIDKLMLEQEKESKAKQHQIVELKNQNKHLNNEVKQVHEELEQEKADRELRATQLISELEDLKQKLQTEKQKGQELQQENEKLIKSTQEKENIIQEITETSEYTKASHTQEVETLAKEIQKHQNSLEKSKQQLIQKSNEWKEKYEKLEKTLQQKFLVKEKEMMLKIEDLEKKCNSVEFSVTQLQRENNGLKDELNAEKNNLSLNIQKNEKIKENYESKIFELTSEIAKLDKKIKETELNYIKSNEELLDQQKINEDKMNKIFEDLKQTKAKNSKLIKACKDLENTIKDLEEKNNQKTEEIANLIKTFESDKAGLSAEINALGVENNDINKDRTKLIKKVENLSKKLSQIAKQKEKLYTETETKQQEFNTLIEQREQLEADLEQTKGQIKELAETIQSLQSQNSQQKSEIKTLTAESNKKEIAIQAYQKTIQDLQNTIVNNESDLKDLREALRDLKESNESYGNTVNILGNDKAQISKELKVCKEALEKISKDFKNALDQHKALEAEKNESNLLYAQQKQQLTNKINKLTEEYKQLELNFFNITNELRKKISEIETAKESLIILTDSILKGFSNQKDKIFKICEVKTSLLSHIQLSLTTKISKLKQTIKEKSHKIEKLEISNKKELLLLSESHAKELQGLKLSNKDYIDALEDKFSQETQELQTYYEDIIRKSNSKNEKAQDELKAFYMAQIDHLNKTHAFSVEELKSSHARSLNEINQAHAQEISEIKEDNSRKIKEYETEIKKNNLKHAETVEIINKDWENKLEHLKSLHEESFNQMITFRQKEIEQLSKENTHLRLEFENSLDRQKNHSFVLKTHQQTLIEDVSKSYKQEIEALNIEHDTKIKRKDNEISDLKKKSKESNEKLESLKKELEILNEIYEKTKNDLKKIESDLKKTEHHRQQLEETQKLLTKKYEFEKNKNNELVSTI